MGAVLDYIDITFRQDLNILFFRFNGPVLSEQLRAGYRSALAEAKAKGGHCWLIDLRRRGAANAEDEAWLLNDFFPAVEADLPGCHYYAYLVTPSIYHHIREEVGFDFLSEFRQNSKIRIFDAEQQAVEWLSGNHKS